MTSTTWGNNDVSSNSPFFTSMQLNHRANTANRNNLYGNVTANAFVNGLSVGVFGVSAGEMGHSGYVKIGAAVDAVNGTGYVPGDHVNVSGAAVNATSNATLNVTATQVVTCVPHTGNIGTGYVNGDIVRLTTGTGTTMNAAVTTGAANTSVASLTIRTPGLFTVNPTLSNSPTANSTGAGSGLYVDVTVGIATLAVVSAGIYAANTLTLANNALTGGTGTGAKANITTSSRSEAQKVAAAGWVLRKQGTGQKANRVQYETLVAMRTIAADTGGDDAEFP